MEARASGVVRAEDAPALLELLAGFSGQTPAAVALRELVLAAELEGRRDVRLLHASLPGDAGPGAWTASQRAELPLGDKRAAGLGASVHTVVEARCEGPDVPAFWAALGFRRRYELVRQGHTADVEVGGRTVTVLVARALRAGGEEVAPGHLLVEAWTQVAPEGAGDGDGVAAAVAALAELGTLLAPLTALGPLPTGRKGKYLVERRV